VNKEKGLHWAELIDSYRVFPRLFLLACFLWTLDMSYVLLKWYMHLPKDERGVEASGFASIAFLAVLGFLKLVYQTYSDAGRDWNAQPSSTSTTVMTSATQVSK
jgi:hypothetical protein